MKKIIAALIVSTFAVGAFAQSAAAVAPSAKPAMGKKHHHHHHHHHSKRAKATKAAA